MAEQTASPSLEQNEADFKPTGALTDVELGLFDQLKTLALDYAQDDREKGWLDDMCILRYLRAREWKLEKSEKMLKATLDWRREWQVEDIQREDVILTLELKSLYRNGVDKHERPVMFIKPSYNGNSVEYRLRSLIYSLEESTESMNKAHGVEKMCLIADFDTESKLAKKSPDGSTIAKNFLNFLQNHYPERLGICFALNPPWYIRLLYTVVSPFMDSVTKKKIHFLNGDAAYIKKNLLQHIDEDQLEQCYGGTREIGPESDVRFARMERERSKNTSEPSPLPDEEQPETSGKKKRKKRKDKEEFDHNVSIEALDVPFDEEPVDKSVIPAPEDMPNDEEDLQADIV